MEMFVATVVLSGLLAVVFGAGAAGKLTRARSELDKATKLRIPWPRYRLIAVPEAAAVVALMAGALVFRIRVRDAIPWLLGDAAVLVLAAVTATLRAVTA